MRLSSFEKILLGVLTIWPPVYGILFIAFIFINFIFSDNPSFTSFWIVLPLHILTMILCIGLLVFYIAHIIKNIDLKEDRRIIWIILLFICGIIAMIVYWYLYIWRKRETKSSESPDTKVDRAR